MSDDDFRDGDGGDGGSSATDAKGRAYIEPKYSSLMPDGAFRPDGKPWEEAGFQSPDEKNVLEHSTDDAGRRLKSEWGVNFDDAKEAARIAVDRFDSNSNGRMSRFLNETRLGNDPAVFRQMVAAGRRIQEGRSPGITANEIIEMFRANAGGPLALLAWGRVSKIEAYATISQVMQDPDHPYHTSRVGDPVHDQISRMYQIVYDED